MKHIAWSAVTFVAISSLSQAQDASAPQPPPTETANSKTKAEVIQVTGSRIKRTDVEGPTQVQTVTKEDMEASGQTTVSDVLREIPVSIAGSTREESNRGAPGFSGVNLRGIGEKYTLVLIDGHRLPPDPAFDAVDVGAIPTAMIERIEVLKEGAGAIYGSDAVGGVVNIITKKAFDGTSVLYSHSKPEGKGGVEKRFEVVTGKTFDNGNGSVVISGSYRNRELIMSKDRSFIGDGWSLSGAPGSFVPIAVDGINPDGTTKYKNKGTFAADPNCASGPNSRVTDTGDSGTFCEFNYERVRSISPEITDYSLMAKTDYQLNDNFGVYALLKTLRRDSKDLIAPAPTDGQLAITAPAAVQNIKNALGAAGDAIDLNALDGVKIRYRTVPLGNRDTRTEDVSNYGVLGFKGQLTNTWDWDVSYSHGVIDRKEKGENGFWLKDKLPNIIASGRFNPFDPNDSGAALQEAAYETLATQQTTTSQAMSTFSGNIGEMAGGAAQLAVGVSWVSEKFTTDADAETRADNVQGSSFSQGGGKRKTSAVFAETALPVIQNAELNLAARFDHYEKYGDTLNPRAAFKYRMSDVLLRTSVGTGFRAPTLQEETTQSGASYPIFVDAVQCNNAKATNDAEGVAYYCNEQQYEYNQKPTDNVKPEKVFIYSLGAVYAPTQTSNVSIDYWAMQVKDSIGIPDLSQLTRLEATGNRSFESKDVSVNRDPDTGAILNVSAPATNLSSKELSGIDVSGNFTIGSKQAVTFEYALDTSYQLYYRVAPFEGSPLENQTGRARQPRFRANNTFGTSFLSDHHLAAVVKSTAGTRKVNEDLGKIPSFHSYDLHYTYSALLNGSFTFGVLNAANLQPPKDESANPSINFDLYSYAGRSYYVRLTQNF